MPYPSLAAEPRARRHRKPADGAWRRSGLGEQGQVIVGQSLARRAGA